jgi:hypothetical protein
MFCSGYHKTGIALPPGSNNGIVALVETDVGDVLEISGARSVIVMIVISSRQLFLIARVPADLRAQGIRIVACTCVSYQSRSVVDTQGILPIGQVFSLCSISREI